MVLDVRRHGDGYRCEMALGARAAVVRGLCCTVSLRFSAPSRLPVTVSPRHGTVTQLTNSSLRWKVSNQRIILVRHDEPLNALLGSIVNLLPRNRQ